MFRHLGNLNLYLIKESSTLRTGEFPLFIQGFLLEIHALCRAHVVARGGNALLSYRITQCGLYDSPARNQGQALLMVTGDVAELRPLNRLTSAATSTFSQMHVGASTA